MKILVIEDDQVLAKNLKLYLEKDGFIVDVVFNKKDSFVAIEINEYDCVILDIGLPDGNGFDVLKELRGKKNNTPVIIATARGQVEDKIKGLNLGADDYIPKPIDSNELIARIRAVIRRAKNSALPIITIGGLIVKPAEHFASIDNHTLNLTAKEFSVLEYLALHSGQVVTRIMLMEHIWGSDFETFSNVVDVYIRTLRRKLGEYSKIQYIKTIRGKGYILKNEGKK